MEGQNVHVAKQSTRLEFLTVEEIAVILRVKPRTIYDMVAQNRIPYRKVGRRVALKEKSKGKHVFESRKKPGYPIQEPKKAFKAALKDAEIENFRFHDLRHTAGTRLAEAGVDAFTIKDILGHSSIQTSAIYVHATDEGKRRAVVALGRYAEKFGQNLVKNEKEQAG